MVPRIVCHTAFIPQQDLINLMPAIWDVAMTKANKMAKFASAVLEPRNRQLRDKGGVSTFVIV